MTDDWVAFAEDEFAIGKMSERDLYKVYLQAASEYLAQYGDLEKAMVTIYKVPSYFVENRLKTEMETDEPFAKSMVELANHLERQGVTFVTPLVATQTEGKA